MADQSTIHGDFYFPDNVVFGGTLELPNGSVDAEDIAAAAGIEVSKMSHRHVVTLSFEDTVEVTSQDFLVYIAKAAGTLSSVKIVNTTNPTGTDELDIDIKKNDGAGGAFTSVLTAAETLTASTAESTVISATISTSAYAADSVFKVSLTYTSDGGVSAKGLIVELVFDEAYTA